MFFFKQKTAYEVRISDWSSDVCSSDLQHQADAERGVHAEQGGVAMQRGQVQALHVVQRQRRVDQETEQAGTHQVPEADREEEQDGPEIGRASCRDRVCTYV